MEKNVNWLHPFNVQSGWLPEFGSGSLQKFINKVLTAEREEYAEPIKELDKFIEGNSVIKYLVDSACRQNANIEAQYNGVFDPGGPVPNVIPRIKDKDTILHAFNYIIKNAPQYIDNELVGLPFSAFVVGIDATLGGSVLFRLPMFNEKLAPVLNAWNQFLETEASNTGFSVEGVQWLSKSAKDQYDFKIWKKDSETLPYWKSWNSFFTRQFSDPAAARPIAGKDSNRIVISPNDGSLFKWRPNIQVSDVFWFKDMNYSLTDILSSSVSEQQDVIDKYKLVDIFKGGYIFQMYLNPYNFHRWWVPVNGTVLFDPLVVPGCYFSKLVLPDFGGATTASTPYLSEVNARGIVVFKTEDFGHVCCIPLGMSEVSSVVFDKQIVAGARVTKGQEMGMFFYGGSSFAIIYEKLPNKSLFFVNAAGTQYDQDPPPPGSSSGTGGEPTNIGSQIGIWVDL